MKRIASILLLLLVYLPSLSAQESAEIIGNCMFIPNKDPITDVDKSMVVITQENPSITQEARLFFRTSGDSLDIIIKPGAFFILGFEKKPVKIVWRFDSEDAIQDVDWSPSTDNAAAFCPDAWLRPFVRGSRRCQKLVIRLWDVSGTPHTFTFGLTGFTAAFSKLACSQYYR